jgi:dTDP-4-amino-4,6-dideoxygalactose transaminase
VSYACNSAFTLNPADTPASQSAWNLYTIRLAGSLLLRRNEIFQQLRDAGIGVQVHHIPVHTHPFYEQMGHKRGEYPIAEKIYDSVISLPLYPDLTAADQQMVIDVVKRIAV